jgi:hypothetical protein
MLVRKIPTCFGFLFLSLLFCVRLLAKPVLAKALAREIGQRVIHKQIVNVKASDFLVSPTIKNNN